MRFRFGCWHVRLRLFWQEEKSGLGLGVGGFGVRWPGVRFRFGCWHVKFRFFWQEEKLSLGLGLGDVRGA